MPSSKKELTTQTPKKVSASEVPGLKGSSKIPKKLEVLSTEKSENVKTDSSMRINFSLILVIVFIASIVSATFVFAGLKTYPSFFITQGSNPTEDNQAIDKAVDEGIQRFIKQQQEDQQANEETQQKETEQKAQNVRELSKNEDHVRGNIKADISIIEYSDFECPYCKRNHPTVKQVFEKYDGKVNWVYRHLPLPFHLPNAQDQAEASECVADLAGNDAFWEFNDLIYERTPSNKGFNFEQLRPLAEELGVNGEKFDACMESDKYLAKIQSDSKEADSMGVRGTPANLIRNNKTGEVKFLGGAYPLESFEAVIDDMLQ